MIVAFRYAKRKYQENRDQKEQQSYELHQDVDDPRRTGDDGQLRHNSTSDGGLGLQDTGAMRQGSVVLEGRDEGSTQKTPEKKAAKKRRRVYRTKIILAMFLPFTLQALDTTMIATALPLIAKEFGGLSPFDFGFPFIPHIPSFVPPFPTLAFTKQNKQPTYHDPHHNNPSPHQTHHIKLTPKNRVPPPPHPSRHHLLPPLHLPPPPRRPDPPPRLPLPLHHPPDLPLPPRPRLRPLRRRAPLLRRRNPPPAPRPCPHGRRLRWRQPRCARRPVGSSLVGRVRAHVDALCAAQRRGVGRGAGAGRGAG